MCESCVCGGGRRRRRFCPAAAEPCVGVGGLRSWIEASDSKYTATVCHDFGSDIQKFYQNLVKAGSGGLQQVKAGQKQGDLLAVNLEEQADCEIRASVPALCWQW